MKKEKKPVEQEPIAQNVKPPLTRRRKPSIRKVIKPLLEMEPLLFELICDHELQKGDVLALISTWIDTHAPEAIEVYTEEKAGPPIFFYGHIDGLKRLLGKTKKKEKE